VRPPRKLVGRIFGGIPRNKVLSNDEPMWRNSPTMRAVQDERNFELDRKRLRGHRPLCRRWPCWLHHAPAQLLRAPHSRRMGHPDALMYKHLDHHLRQFGV
jgi:hypothetical protein